MHNIWTITRREFVGYFITPIAYVFIVIFLLMAGFFTFSIEGFYEAGQADLSALFKWLPWMFLFLIPAVAMRLWSEERRTGTIELLMTLPVTHTQAVLGKFLAAWAFIGIALMLTFPLWITVAYLGNPDNGVIFTGYVGSLLMAGAYLAIGSCLSATTKNQVIAFIITVVLCFALNLAGISRFTAFLQGYLPASILDAIRSFSFLTRFDSISKGVFDLRDFIFFLSLIGAFLYANAVIIDLKKAN